ncbi:MAG TPA: hydrogenase iron-sulfur subunit, partial [Euryarchaeota archaeon]|nr:hydrogenase iron-sulfur subunit [Euryarchaeota archaeon]
LILGGQDALELAQDIADFEADIHILNSDPYFKRGSPAHPSFSPASRGSPFQFEDASVTSGAKITGISGDLGDFTVEFETGRRIDISKCVDCEKCIEVCPEKAISRPDDSIFPSYIISDKCTDCGECQTVCPTGAIQLESETDTLKIGQIITFYDTTPREGVYKIKSKDRLQSQAAALKAALNLQGYKKERYITSNVESCANKYLSEKNLNMQGCTYCEDRCAYYPVSSGVVSELSCQGCGSCVTACPQEVLNLKLHPTDAILDEIDSTIEAKIKDKIIVFTCSEGGYSTLKAAGLNKLKYPAALPVFVPCLGSVSPSHILRAFDVGAEGVLLLGCGADSCMHESGFAQGSDSVSQSKKILEFFGVGKECVRLLKADGSDPEKFISQINEFSEKIKKASKNPLLKKTPADIGSAEDVARHKRAVFHTLISGFSEKTGVIEGRIEGDFKVALLTVNESECTLCGACAFHCNTGAFKFEGEELLDISHIHANCIGCGICQKICPENVISLESVIDVAPFIGMVAKKFDVKIIRCEVCGKPLMAEAAMRKINSRLKEKGMDMVQKCQSCIDRGTVANILNIDKDGDDFVVIQQGKTPWDS